MSKKWCPIASQNGRAAVGVDHAAHLGEDDRVEASGELGHEQEPRQRQEPAVAAGAVVGGEEQAADLGRAVVLGDEVKRLDLLADAEERPTRGRRSRCGRRRTGSNPPTLETTPLVPTTGRWRVLHHEQVDSPAGGRLGHLLRSCGSESWRSAAEESRSRGSVVRP